VGWELIRASSSCTVSEQVTQLDNILTQQLGDEILVAVKARLHSQGSEVALIEAINRVETGFRTAFPQVRWLFFEPDVTD
jgi:hypothetical protein